MKKLIFPDQMIEQSSSAIWELVGKAVNMYSGRIKNMQVDLSRLKYFDVQSSPYIAMVPYFFKQKNITTRIILPEKSDCLDMMIAIGLVQQFEKDFELIGERMGFIAKSKYMTQSPSLRIGKCFVVSPSEVSPLLVSRKMDEFAELIGCVSDNAFQSFVELCDNIFQHSGQHHGSVSFRIAKIENQHKRFYSLDNRLGRKRVQRTSKDPVQDKLALIISVHDLGIGIGESFRRSNYLDFPHRTLSDEQYLDYALQSHTTSTGMPDRGMGLNAVANMSDYLSIKSGTGTVQKVVESENAKVFRNRTYIPGTQVTTKFYFDNKHLKASLHGYKVPNLFMPSNTLQE